MEALKKVAEEGMTADEMPPEEHLVVNLLKDGLRDYIDDALDEAERYKRVDRSHIQVDFKWDTCGNFNEFPALHRSRLENGPGKPYKGGDNPNEYETTIFASLDLGLVLESPRDGQWSRFGGESPVILDILPGSAAARALPRIKRGLRVDTINGAPLATLGPQGFKRLQGVRPLRLGLKSQPLDYIPGAGKHCQGHRPDIFAQTMAVDFMRDFGPSAEETAAARARKAARFGEGITWSDSRNLPDLERRVTRLHQGLSKTGWPPGTQRRGSKGAAMRRGSVRGSVSVPLFAMRRGTVDGGAGAPLFAATAQPTFAASGHQSPGASMSSTMNLSSSAPHLGFPTG